MREGFKRPVLILGPGIAGRQLGLGLVLALVGVVVAALSFSVEGLVQCADPGGCQEIPLVSWPLLAGGFALVVVGSFVAGRTLKVRASA